MTNDSQIHEAAKSVDSIDWLAIISAQRRYDIDICQYYGDATMEVRTRGDYIHYDDLMEAINAALSSANTKDSCDGAQRSR